LLKDTHLDVFQINSDESFQHCYNLLTSVLLNAAWHSFTLPSDPLPKRKVSNPTIRLILQEIHRINWLLGTLSHALRTNTPPSFPHAAWVPLYLSAFNQITPLMSNFTENFQTFLKTTRRQLHKVHFTKEHLERRRRSEKAATHQIQAVLHGGSSKRMFSTKFSSLPLAICPQLDTQLDQVVTGPSNIKSATVQYFQNLYHRMPCPTQTKPWMHCPSVSHIAECVDANPFLWPQPLDTTQMRKLLAKGNSCPTPGPDGWETLVPTTSYHKTQATACTAICSLPSFFMK